MRARSLVRRNVCTLISDSRSISRARQLPSQLCGSRELGWSVRRHARPASVGITSKVAFKPPPPPKASAEPPSVEDGHSPGEAEDTLGPFDHFLAETALSLRSKSATSVPKLYLQYQEKGGRMCKYVVPYDERPGDHKRADQSSKDADDVGDGIVMVVHTLFKPGGKLDKVCACSGFVVDGQSGEHEKQGEIIITCAHTLEEMYRRIRRVEDQGSIMSFSFIVPSHGKPRRVGQLLSSMPRSDVVAMQLEPNQTSAAKLRSLPLSPFPVQPGMTLLTHLFGTPEFPNVIQSQSRLPPSSKDHPKKSKIETPTRWLGGQAWRRWGAGTMLGYRSYTNIEVEAGIHSSLPHILTSVLPTSGSSGGPIVNAETGAIVGMTSGRRMDNRVEGERGWGASSESIFEMFSLPGFTPTSN